MFGYAMDGHRCTAPIPRVRNPTTWTSATGTAPRNSATAYLVRRQNQVIECLVGQTVAGADAGDEVVLASNTSSIPIMKLAMATTRPEQVIGLHFFNPVPVLPLLEVVTSLLTSERTTATATRFASEVLGSG